MSSDTSQVQEAEFVSIPIPTGEQNTAPQENVKFRAWRNVFASSKSSIAKFCNSIKLSDRLAENQGPRIYAEQMGLIVPTQDPAFLNISSQMATPDNSKIISYSTKIFECLFNISSVIISKSSELTVILDSLSAGTGGIGTVPVSDLQSFVKERFKKELIFRMVKLMSEKPIWEAIVKRNQELSTEISLPPDLRSIFFVIWFASQDRQDGVVLIGSVSSDSDNNFLFQAKHKLFLVGGRIFESFDIYGQLDSNYATDSISSSQNLSRKLEEVTNSTTKECIICMAEEKTTILLPCRHLCVCDTCGDILRNQTFKCPICRQPFSSLLTLSFQQ